MKELERERLKKKSEKDILDDIFDNKAEDIETDFSGSLDIDMENILEKSDDNDVVIDFTEDSDTKDVMRGEKEKEKVKDVKRQEKIENSSAAKKEKQAEKETDKDKIAVFIDFTKDSDIKLSEQEKDLLKIQDHEGEENSIEIENEKDHADEKKPWWFYLLIVLGIAAVIFLLLL